MRRETAKISGMSTGTAIGRLIVCMGSMYGGLNSDDFPHASLIRQRDGVMNAAPNPGKRISLSDGIIWNKISRCDF